MQNKKLIVSIVYRVVVLLALAAALRLVGGMVRLVFAVLGILAAMAGIMGKKISYKKRVGILLLLAVLFVGMNTYYNTYHLEEMLPLRSTVNQHMYQETDRADCIFGEAYLRELIRDKKVLVPYAVSVLFDYVPIENEDERGAGFKPNYYWDNNYTRYFQEYALDCETDESLPKRLEVPEFIEGKVSDFQDYGITNDLLRYTFLLNREHAKETKYFWYSWYYYSFAEEENRYPHMYLIPEDCEAADTLVAIWDRDENIYIMSMEKYAEVKG